MTLIRQTMSPSLKRFLLPLIFRGDLMGSNFHHHLMGWHVEDS